MKFRVIGSLKETVSMREVNGRTGTTDGAGQVRTLSIYSSGDALAKSPTAIEINFNYFRSVQNMDF